MDSAMQKVLERGDLILRNDVEYFENAFARYVGTRYAVALNSGTDALYFSLLWCMKPGGEVIVPSYTFKATIGAIVHAGAIPVLADYGDDWQKYRTEKTIAILPVHMEGKILEWKKEDLPMIEDACQAVGAGPVQGIAACYSFYPAKILGCYGDGGAIATNDRNFAEELRKMRHHYKGFDNQDFGFNSRLDNLQAAVLNVKLKKMPEYIRKRKEIARIYDECLKDVVGTPAPREVYQDYIITTKHRDALHDFLQARDIDTLANEYPFPAGYTKGPKTLAYERESLRIPCNPEMSEEDARTVVRGIQDFFTQKNL